MAKKRKFCSYRGLERPYTRFSKYKKMSFVKARPVSKIVRFNMGSAAKQFEYKLRLISKTSLQIRDLALESARLTSNRVLELTLGKNGYRLMLNLYPHHILRENAAASGAGADRMSTGMQLSFGKTVGLAAQIQKGKTIFTLEVDKQNLELAKKALKRASKKLPNSYLIDIAKNKIDAAKKAAEAAE